MAYLNGKEILFSPKLVVGEGGGDYDQGYNDGFVEGEEEGYTAGYTNGWDFGESSGTHDGFDVGIGLEDDTKTVVCFSGYQSGSMSGSYDITLDNPTQLIVTVSAECHFDLFEIFDAEGTNQTVLDGTVNAGTYTFDIPDWFVCSAEGGYGVLEIEGSCSDYGIVGVSVTNRMSYAEGVEDGKQAEYDAFWDDFQQNGTRNKYNYAFPCFGEVAFKPKYDIIVTTECSHMFYGNEMTIDLQQRLDDLGIVMDFSKATNMNNVFAYAQFLRVGVIDLSGVSGTINSTFYTFYRCHTIEKLILKDDGSQSFSTNFITGMNALKNIVVEGTIGNNNWNLSMSTNLTHASLMSIINALKDFSGTTETRSITFGATNLAKLTDEEIAMATEKGWTLA